MIRKINRPPSIFSIASTEPVETRVHNKYHSTAPADAVYIGRGSPYGNKYSHMENTKAEFKVGTREEAIEMFEKHQLPHMDLTPLIGRHLICFCKPKACHGDSIIKALKCLES